MTEQTEREWRTPELRDIASDLTHLLRFYPEAKAQIEGAVHLLIAADVAIQIEDAAP